MSEPNVVVPRSEITAAEELIESLSNRIEDRDRRIAELEAKLQEAESERDQAKGQLSAAELRADTAEAKLARVREAARAGVILATNGSVMLQQSTSKCASLFAQILDIVKE